MAFHFIQRIIYCLLFLFFFQVLPSGENRSAPGLSDLFRSLAEAEQLSADASHDQILRKNRLLGSEIVLDGKSFGETDVESLSFTWYGPFAKTEGDSPAVFLPEGKHTVSLRIFDGSSDSDIDTALIEIIPCFEISVSSRPGKVRLNWEMQDNIDRFNVYRADEPDLASFKKIALSEPTSTSFIDSTVSDGTVYFYIIESLSQDEGCYSGLVSSKPVTWRDNRNNEPIIYSKPVSYGSVGVKYNYDLNATDPDQDLLSFRLTNNPEEMNIDAATGLIEWTPEYAGTYDIVIEVDDGNGGRGAQSFILTVEGPKDEDGDKYSVKDGDCDDNNPEINPGAVEICNGIDDDCDGLIDEGLDADGDEVTDCFDDCPDDPGKTEPGDCGCGVEDKDSDSDGILDCKDLCADDPKKTEPGECGCGVEDKDSDSDGTVDCNDLCIDDPQKTKPGICGCGIADTDTDTDEDGTIDCLDGCIDNPAKTEPGPCGCNADETDTDEDGTIDCLDGCITDPNKTEPGGCGCGVAEIDSDNDGIPDCNDRCINDPGNDLDSDGVCGDLDRCPRSPSGSVVDSDGCSDAHIDLPVFITKPVDKTLTNEPQQTITGRISDLGTTSAILLLNGTQQDLSITDGSFNETVTLKEGVNKITILAGNTAGKEISNEVEVTLDTIVPVLLLPSDTTVNAEGPSGAVHVFGAAAADNNDLFPGIECLPASGSLFPHGETIVNCTAKDAAGNSSNGSFRVIINK